MKSSLYTTQLQAGLGMIDETRSLLELWQAGTDVPALFQAALQSGRFPTMSARRLRNVVAECFAPRFLAGDVKPAVLLKTLGILLSAREFEQLLFTYTCRASAVLADFVGEVYWNAYTSGRQILSNDEAKDFVTRANQDGKTLKPWSASTVRRVASYLTGCCADFGLLERGAKSVRKILHYRIEPRTAAILSHELHFAGHGDNAIVANAVWTLFGMDRADVLNELRRLALKGLFIVQSAGDVTRIAWQCKDLEELGHVLAQG